MLRWAGTLIVASIVLNLLLAQSVTAQTQLNDVLEPIWREL